MEEIKEFFDKIKAFLTLSKTDPWTWICNLSLLYLEADGK